MQLRIRQRLPAKVIVRSCQIPADSITILSTQTYDGIELQLHNRSYVRRMWLRRKESRLCESTYLNELETKVPL